MPRASGSAIQQTNGLLTGVLPKNLSMATTNRPPPQQQNGRSFTASTFQVVQTNLQWATQPVPPVAAPTIGPILGLASTPNEPS